jgi:hypothetical protein
MCFFVGVRMIEWGQKRPPSVFWIYRIFLDLFRSLGGQNSEIECEVSIYDPIRSKTDRIYRARGRATWSGTAWNVISSMAVNYRHLTSRHEICVKSSNLLISICTAVGLGSVRGTVAKPRDFRRSGPTRWGPKIIKFELKIVK